MVEFMEVALTQPTPTTLNLIIVEKSQIIEKEPPQVFDKKGQSGLWKRISPFGTRNSPKASNAMETNAWPKK